MINISLHHALRPARLAASLTIMILTVVATACGNTPTNSPAAADEQDEVFPVTLQHALGSITIEEQPKRIVTLGEDLDTLAAVGVTPVAYAPIAPGYTDDVPYHQGKIDLSDATVLDAQGSGEFSIEEIAAAQPDLILASNYYGIDKLYPELSRIAPTLAYEKGWGETGWAEMSITIGTAIGHEQEVRDAVAETEQYLRNLKAELPGLEGKAVVGAYYHAAGTFASNPRSASMSKYEALGMEVSPKLLAEKPEGATDNSVSLERIDVLDADLLILSFGSDTLRKQLENSPLYQNLGAVRHGAVHHNDPSDALPTFAGNGPTVLNVVWILDQQREALETAAG